MAEDIPFKEKIKTISISPSAMPTRRNNIPPKVNPSSNAWERGVVRDSRGMPLLDESGSQVGLKEYAQDKKKYEEGRKKTLHRAREIEAQKETD